MTPSGPRELGQPLGGAGCPVLPAGHTEPPQIASESRILATFCYRAHSLVKHDMGMFTSRLIEKGHR